jgi:hypothetical protein
MPSPLGLLGKKVPSSLVPSSPNTPNYKRKTHVLQMERYKRKSTT